MTTKPKTHLSVGPVKVACGLFGARFRTTEIGKVTCAGCARSLHMADREVESRLNKGQ